MTAIAVLVCCMAVVALVELFCHPTPGPVGTSEQPAPTVQRVNLRAPLPCAEQPIGA